jgi:uncharacterized protein with HEPN domain
VKDDRVYLEHILDCINRISEYTELKREKFFDSRLIQDASLRNLQIMAESMQRLSEGIKKQHPETNWRAIAGFRNILVHDYLGLDLPLIWDIIEHRLPPLKVQIQAIWDMTVNDKPD